jgi:hypothetical protein
MPKRVNEQKQDSVPKASQSRVRSVHPEPNKINASTPYDFNGKNLTPYGGLLPVVTMLEKLGFQSLVEQTVTSKRIPRVMDLYRFVLGIVLGLYIGFPRLNQLRFIARDPILTGILQVTKLPVQSTFWRFVNALHRNVARQMLAIMKTMRERVWEAANVRLEVVTIDTDTTVHTLYGLQMGGRKSYNPKNKRQEELPADVDVYRRNARIRLGRVAQWRSAHGQADRRSSAECRRIAAAGCEADLWPGGLGILLPGSCRRI